MSAKRNIMGLQMVAVIPATDYSTFALQRPVCDGMS